MLRTPWKLLASLSALLAGLGLVIVLVAGYSGASVLVPFRCALVVLAGGLLILRFGPEHRFGKPIFYIALSVILLFGLNFTRLGLKWHGSMGWTSIQPIAGLLMGVVCVWVSSCLWALRPVSAAGERKHREVTSAWRPLIPAMCALAVIVGVMVVRAPSGPQGALAAPESTEEVEPRGTDSDTHDLPEGETQADTTSDSEIANPN